MVQVMAARRLFERGIMVKDGGALERLETVDTVVLDKTGTLTTGQPRLMNIRQLPLDLLATAGALAARSRHPHAAAIAAAAGDMPAPTPQLVAEIPGCGVEAVIDGETWRLGRADWALTTPGDIAGTVLARAGTLAARFAFEDILRPGAAAAVARLREAGYALEIVSGDNAVAVAAVADRLGILHWTAGVTPEGKTRRLAALAAAGRRVLMVGDGLNDAPALASAQASMAPANAADVGRSAADVVFLRDSLVAVSDTLGLAKAAGRLVRQNLALALGYNVVAIPIAVLGYATPFVAAIAMSLSSVVVVANALRLGWPRGGNRTDARTLTSPRAEVTTS
jgi:Cu2+-exporting ATPase